MRWLRAVVVAIVLAGTGGAVRAEEGAGWPALSSGVLRDNSFLIEEAYNQEPGVVQHILGAAWDQKSRTWTATFTQEWPAPNETHQLSFTVPYAWVREPDGTRGPGDVLLYRYQLLAERARQPALAPRLSLVLPTGSIRDELGNGSAGVQVFLPASKQITERLATHLNVGTTILPKARAVDPARTERLVSWMGGGSVVWAPYHAVNFLGELVASRDAEIGARGVDHKNRVTLSPGVRVGWNGPWGSSG